mmetsp:Transcript_39561/g.126222  ORF Transcript_39561/g.126222 Transcript_39561/m.126222 type:complete len:262 (-) Transcript_39561:3612-4397(-)
MGDGLDELSGRGLGGRELLLQTHAQHGIGRGRHRDLWHPEALLRRHILALVPFPEHLASLAVLVPARVFELQPPRVMVQRRVPVLLVRGRLGDEHSFAALLDIVRDPLHGCSKGVCVHLAHPSQSLLGGRVSLDLGSDPLPCWGKNPPLLGRGEDWSGAGARDVFRRAVVPLLHLFWEPGVEWVDVVIVVGERLDNPPQRDRHGLDPNIVRLYEKNVLPLLTVLGVQPLRKGVRAVVHREFTPRVARGVEGVHSHSRDFAH